MRLSTPTNQPQTQARIACCPTCHTRTEFSFAGEQRWPDRVAKATGIEPVVRLWHCGECNTTISECDMVQ